MPTNISDPFYLFDAIPRVDAGVDAEIDLLTGTISDAYRVLKKDASRETIEANMAASARAGDAYELLRGVFLSFMKSQRLYHFMNCTSMSDYCARQTNGAFAISPATLSDDLACAATLERFEEGRYAEGIATFLETEGQAKGMGFKRFDHSLPMFRIADFVGHKSKLKFLGYLMNNSDKPIDWSLFFSSSFDGYESFIEDIKRRSRDASARVPHDSPKHASMRPGGNPFAEDKVPQAQADPENTTSVLDPFSPDDKSPAIPLALCLPLNLNPLFVGTLTGIPIYNDSRLYPDAGYMDRIKRVFGGNQ